MALYNSQIKSITNIFCHEMYIEMICILFHHFILNLFLAKSLLLKSEKFSKNVQRFDQPCT